MQANYKFDREILDAFQAIKNESYRGEHFCIPVYEKGLKVAFLTPITRRHLYNNQKNEDLIRLLVDWRKASAKWYPTNFRVTEEGTKTWLKDKVIGAEDRLLFMVETVEGIPFGHMGFYRGEADNFIRGRKDILQGGMTLALNALLEWAFSDLHLRDLYLRVFSDNYRAIALYQRCGFNYVHSIPLKKKYEKDLIRWVELSEGNEGTAERFFSVMYIRNPYLM